MFVQNDGGRKFFGLKPPRLAHGVAVSAARGVGQSTDLNCPHTKRPLFNGKTALCFCHSAATGKPHSHLTTSPRRPQPTLPTCRNFNTNNDLQRYLCLASPLPTATIGGNQHLRQKGHHDLTAAKRFRPFQSRPSPPGFGSDFGTRTAFHHRQSALPFSRCFADQPALA